MKGKKKYLSVFLILTLALLVSLPAFGGTGDTDPVDVGEEPAVEQQAAPADSTVPAETEAAEEESAPAETAEPAETQQDTAGSDEQAAEETQPEQTETEPEQTETEPAALAAPAADPDGGEETAKEPYTLKLYGYQFGAYYKRWSTTSTSASYKRNMIGYPEMLEGEDSIQAKLTVNGIQALKEKPFTFAAAGFDLEGDGFVKTEKNTYDGYYYDVIGFVPVKDTDITGLRNTDAYAGTYSFDSEEDAKTFVQGASGVLYGETPGDPFITALQEKGSVAMVWAKHDPFGFKNAYLSVTPTKAAMGEGVAVTLKPGFSTTKKGDYTDTPLTVTLKLDEGLTFSEGETPVINDTDAFAVDQASIKVSEDRKELSFNITQVKKDSSSTVYLPVEAKVDIADLGQEQDTVSLTALNAWGDKKTSSATININRPLIRTKLDDKDNKSLFFSEKDQTVTLKAEHSNAASGETETHVKVTFPDLVTVKSAAVNTACKNTIENLKVTTEDGVSTLEYDVTKFSASSGKATDVIDLVLDVREKGDKEEEKADTACTAAVNGADALVTKNASITASDPYFEVLLYGPQDAWMDMSRGDGRVNSSVRTLRFYGAADETALTMHAWTFDEEPIKGIADKDADGSVMIGQTVRNQYTNMQWKLVGFVPISYWSGDIRDPWDPLYGTYYLEDLDACKQLIQDNNGVLYGDTPTAEQAQSLAQYKDGNGRAKVICVWYVNQPPKEIPAKYSYTEADEYVGKVHPAAYTTTSSGIEVAIESGGASESGVHPYNVTFIIPEDYEIPADPENPEGARYLTLNTEFNEAAKPVVPGFQPGDKLQYNIKVIDKSGKFGYLKDSGAVGTIDYYNAEHMDYSVIGTGFEGYKIENADEKPDGHSAHSRITRRGDNQAIRHLAEISGIAMSQNPTDENVGKALYEIGYGSELSEEDGKPIGPLDEYTGEDGNPEYVKITQKLLDDYYLDYLNAVYYHEDEHAEEDPSTPHYTKFEDLSADEYRMIFNGDNGTQVMETNPVLVDASYYGMYEESILMSAQENGIENYSGTWYWMHDFNEETEGNRFEQEIFDQYGESTTKKDDGSIEHNMTWYQWVTGSRNGNNMQDTYFGLAYQFKLVDAEAELPVSMTKVLTGRAFQKGDEWKFTISAEEDDAPLPEKTEVTLTPEAGEQTAEVDFGPIKYTLRDIGFNEDGTISGEAKTYHYTITESGEVAGVTNDANASREFTISVKWNSAESKLDITKEGFDLKDRVFTNDYKATGDYTFGGSKFIDSRTLTKDDVYQFTVQEKDAEGAAVGDPVTITNTAEDAAASGKINYPKLEFLLDKDHPDVLGDHTYVIKEAVTDAGGITADSKEYTVVLNVADNGDGTLNVTAKEGEGLADGLKLDFVNQYEADGTAAFDVTKVLDGRDWIADGKKKDVFEFALTPVTKDAPMPAGAEEGRKTIAIEAGTVLTDPEGTAREHTASFGPITFSMDDMEDAAYIKTDAGDTVKQKVFEYEIKEVIPEKKARFVTYDENTYLAAVTVTDDAKGNLTAEVAYTVKPQEGQETPEAAVTDDGALQITNTYEATSLTLTKTIDRYLDSSAQGTENRNITLAFKIVGTDPKTGETIYEKHVGMTFDSGTGLTQSVTVEGVPKKAVITVTEEYSAGYDGSAPATVELNEDGVYAVTMENTHNHRDPGSGVINQYKKTDEGVSGEQKAPDKR